MSRKEKTFNSTPFYLLANPETEEILDRLIVSDYGDLIDENRNSIKIINFLFNRLTRVTSIDRIWNARIYHDEEYTEMYVRLTNNTSAHVLTAEAIEQILEDERYTTEKLNIDDQEVLFAYRAIEEKVTK